jgi:hypothetical protein
MSAVIKDDVSPRGPARRHMSLSVRGPWRLYVRLFTDSRRLLAITVTLSVLQALPDRQRGRRRGGAYVRP